MEIVSLWQSFVTRITGRIHNERGAALVEYALLLALIAVVCIVALQVLGTEAADKFSTIGDQIADAGETP
ncbi:MAG: Flp family type IVb pilin [Acidimicrobiales bacterium]